MTDKGVPPVEWAGGCRNTQEDPSGGRDLSMQSDEVVRLRTRGSGGLRPYEGRCENGTLEITGRR